MRRYCKVKQTGLDWKRSALLTTRRWSGSARPSANGREVSAQAESWLGYGCIGGPIERRRNKMGYPKVSLSRGVTRSVGAFQNTKAELLVDDAREVMRRRPAP